MRLIHPTWPSSNPISTARRDLHLLREQRSDKGRQLAPSPPSSFLRVNLYLELSDKILLRLRFLLPWQLRGSLRLPAPAICRAPSWMKPRLACRSRSAAGLRPPTPWLRTAVDGLIRMPRSYLTMQISETAQNWFSI